MAKISDPQKSEPEQAASSDALRQSSKQKTQSITPSQVLCALLIVILALIFFVPKQGDNNRRRLSRLYSDAFARFLYWPLCEIPYLPKPNATACLNQCLNSSELLITHTVGCAIGDDKNLDPCTGSIVLAHDYQAIVLILRGANSSHQFSYLLDVALKSLPLDDQLIPIGKLNEYVTNAVRVLFVNTPLQAAFNQTLVQYPDYDILVTGHSLGGALAITFGAYIRHFYSDVVPASRILVTSFGSTVVGDLEFAKNYKKLVPYNHRLVHNYDPIPRFAIDMKIPGTDELAYSHVHGDIWYNNTMDSGASFQICPGLKHEGKCTFFYNSSIAHMTPQGSLSHMSYFNAINRCEYCNRDYHLDLLSY